ncbi:hypothetical protein BE08_03935 [Sorangium cellulosum]|uniref:CBM2 domain-containing protein n=1 Tax=Sorangium cellulosum TaxID=56 RepID=A0A150PUJ6_SORCE|nr:hypothetical protein BE08_03935 [Sorangium cellulosum]
MRGEPSNVTVTVTPNATWTGGYCDNIKVTTTGSNVAWKAYVPAKNGTTISSVWNATGTRVGSDFVFAGKDWSTTVSAGSSIDLGYCASGSR